MCRYRLTKDQESWVGLVGAQVSALPSTSCATLDESLNPLSLSFLACNIIVPTSQNYCEGRNVNNNNNNKTVLNVEMAKHQAWHGEGS